MTWKSSGIFAAVVGGLATLYCVVLVIAPDVLPALVGRAGMVWTPINSPLYRYGDSYYYSAWVAETVRHGIPPFSPSAAELAGRPLLETLRWLPLAVAAIPGVFIEDFRVVYVVDYALTATILFGIPFLMAWTLFRSVWGGVVSGIVVLFLAGEWWGRLPVAPGFGAPASILQWLIAGFNVLSRHAFTNFFNMVEYEGDPGSFRYINNSISAPILLLYTYGTFLLYRGARRMWLTGIAVAIASPLMAFSYPSRTLVAYAILSGFAGLAFFEGRKRAAIALSAILALTVIVLLFAGYPGYARRVFAANELWNNIFRQDRIALVDRSIGAMAMIVFVNKYMITFLISIGLVWEKRDLRGLVAVVGLISCAFACVGLFDTPLLWDRFLGRGIDQIWLTCVMLALTSASPLVGEALKNRALLARSWQVVGAVVVVGILLIPARGFGEYAIASSRNLTRFMPEGRWEALRWIDEHVASGTTVAALDWDDITFIPIYTHARLAVDNMIIGGRSPADEIRRYAEVWKILGLSPELLRQRVLSSTGAAMRRLSLTTAELRSPPLVPNAEAYASGQIAEALIYWPYVKTVEGITVADASNAPTAEFVDWAMSFYQVADPKLNVGALGIEYVVLSGAENSLPVFFAAPARLVFANATHRIFRLSRGE